ncbi:MAG: class I SAM-dependent methyltransferase [Thermoanaerobaculia bacterium]
MKEAAAFWDREVVQPSHVSWMADEQVRLYINESISGNPGFWPMDWFSRQYSPRFARALSIGCGTGALERDLLKRGICDRFDAFDGSPVSLDVAKTEAAKLGLSEHIHYSIADFNEPKLPRRAYDAVFFQQSAHHVAKLEKLFRAVLRSLKPGGVLYLDEYIGPSRSDWNDRLLGPLRSINKLLPEEVRTRDDLPLPIQWDDPSEAIRSAEILPQLRIGFRIDAVRGYGGNILSVLFEVMRDPPPALVRQLIAAERELLRAGAEPFCAVIVAYPKRGLAATAANIRYFVEPKMKRVFRELAGFARRASSARGE